MLKNYLALSRQKMFLYLSAFLLITLLMRCNNSGPKELKSNFVDSASHTSGSPAREISSTLYPLLLRNYQDASDPSSNQLEKLLPKRNTPHKIVLQFLKTSDNFLTLVAWSGMKGSKDFKHSEILTIWKNTGIPLNGNVLLGDQEINKKNEHHQGSNDIKALVDVINDPDNKFLLFQPKLDNDTIRFEITGIKDTTPPFQKSALTAISPNPSPPRNAY